jgi:hypothetical protein
MNVTHAFGFFVLGLLMLASPDLMAAGQPVIMSSQSVRTMWLEFMGVVIGGIGSAYMAREAFARVTVVAAAIKLPRLLQPVQTGAKPEILTSAARVGVSS